MARRILDTSILITHWRKFPLPETKRTAKTMGSWAEDLVKKYESRQIVTPVYIEMVAGVTSSAELELTKAYLAPFDIVDEGKISKMDWDEARILAQRVGPKGGKRQLGDCLIRAIANRLNCDVMTCDKRFPGESN